MIDAQIRDRYKEKYKLDDLAAMRKNQVCYYKYERLIWSNDSENTKGGMYPANTRRFWPNVVLLLAKQHK